MAAYSEVLVGVHDEICEILVASPTALTSFTGKLFSHKIIDRQTKQEVFRIDGYRGTSTLLDLLVTINGGIKGIDVGDLRLRVTWFLKSDHPGELLEDKCLCKLDSCVTAPAILLCLVKANLIGHINYKLLEGFVKASGNNPTLKASIEAYEQEYMKLFKCDFSSIMEVFRDPVLTSIPPVSLPDFKIRLGTKWEESNIYTLKEAFERKFPWAEHLFILDVTKNCVLIKYGVLPFFISAVVRDLTDPTVIEELKRENITIELSPELMKYSSLPIKIPFSITSSDVVQFLRTNDVAITDRQKTQLLQQHTLTITQQDSIDNRPEDTAHPVNKVFVYEKAFEVNCVMLERRIAELEEKLKKYEEQVDTCEVDKDNYDRGPNSKQTDFKSYHTFYSKQDTSLHCSSESMLEEPDDEDLLDSPPTAVTMMHELQDLVDWEGFAVHLPHVTHSYVQQLWGMGISHTTTLNEQKMMLLDHWLCIYPNASWNDVANALAKASMFSLALRILDRIPSNYDRDLAAISLSHCFLKNGNPLSCFQVDLTVVDLVRELEGLSLDWEVFVLFLPNITRDDLNTIKQNDKLKDNPSKQKFALFKCWLRDYPEASWDDVINALKESGEYNLASDIELNVHLYYEAPDVSTLCKELKNLTKWEEFGNHLGEIAERDIGRIATKHDDIPSRKLALFSLWLSVCPDASWNDVYSALHGAGEWDLVNDISSKFSN